MLRLLLPLPICLSSACMTSAQTSVSSASGTPTRTLASDGVRQTFLVLVAHPDDENALGPALSKLARMGHGVRVMIATDGKYGTRIADLSPKLLGPLRRKESECALRALGLPPPVFLSIDRLDTRSGVRQYLDGRRKLLAALKEELLSHRPDAIITFGPDGEYGHPEHIVLGAAITELLLRDGLVDGYPLYYLSLTKAQVADDHRLAYVDQRYITHRLVHDDEDELRSFEAARCYRSQMTSDEVQALINLVSEDKTNTSYFRKFDASIAEAP